MKKYSLYVYAILLSLSLSSCLKEGVDNSIGELNSMASIYVVRSTYKGADVSLGRNVLGGAYKTSGTVIATPGTKNLAEGTLIIQDEWRGLVRGLTLMTDNATAASFIIGDSVTVELEGSTLGRFEGGSLAVKGLKPNAINRVAQNAKATIRPVAIAELIKNYQNYENSLLNITADVTPFPVRQPFSGTKILTSGGDNQLPLVTEAGATFASQIIAPSASFIVIPMDAGGEHQLRLRDLPDMTYPSGPIYQGYPEDFESPDAATKASYAGKDIDLRTGNWRLEQCLLGVTTGRDRIVSGKQAIRFQQNLGTSSPSYLQMNYDLPNGAAKVTVWYGAYYTDASSTFVLEYSTNQGTTWTQTGNAISDAQKTSVETAARQATFMMNISGNVRFRIRKLPLGTTSIPTIENGRLGVDDIAIYQGY